MADVSRVNAVWGALSGTGLFRGSLAEQSQHTVDDAADRAGLCLCLVPNGDPEVLFDLHRDLHDVEAVEPQVGSSEFSSRMVLGAVSVYSATIRLTSART